MNTTMLKRLFFLLFATTIGVTALANGGRSSCPWVHITPKRLPDLNTPREGHAVFCVNGELTVAGGHTNGFVPTATAEYLSDGEWHQIPMTYTHDHGTALVLRSGQVLLAGGSKDEMGVGQTFGVEMYNPADHSFTGFGCLSRKRTLASALELDSGRVVITGNWYADDDVEMFDGRKFFNPVKSVTVGRVVPFLFRTSQGDVLILSDRDTYDHLADTVVVDRLKGEPFAVPLLQQWKPLTYNAPITAEVGFIGDEAQGRYAYLMAVRDFKRTHDKPELKGQPAGQMAVVLVEDTVFTLLPTVCPIPMMSQYGSPIFYDVGYIMADREAQQAYFFGVDKDKRLYVVSIGYTQRPAPLTVYYTDPLPDCGFYVPILTPQGHLAIVGGSAKTNYDSDNFTPTASAWLIPLGRQDDAVAAIAGGASAGALWWWLLGFAVVVLLLLAFLIIYKRKSRQGKDQHLEEINTISDEELMQRICEVIERGEQYLTPRLKLSDIAVELGVSVATLTDCISRQRNCTFAQLVAEYRVRYAQQLLADNPDMKLSIVITKSGFTSETTFFRTFKTVTGLSPKEWVTQNNF